MRCLQTSRLLVAGILCLSQTSHAEEIVSSISQAPVPFNELGPAITLSDSEIESMTAAPGLKKFSPSISPRTSSTVATSGFTINRMNRNAVAAGYQRYYLASVDFESVTAWTGSASPCNAGTVSSTFQDHTLRRINYYRAQAGVLADIFFTTEKNEKSQEAALMMAANNDLSHTPPTSWLCYTQDGFDAAFAGNLALGSYGPESIDQLIEDDGSNNAAVGHRRWFLFLQAQEMGNGSIPSSGTFPYTYPEHPDTDVVWVIGDFKGAQPAQAVAWPNDGYVPWNLVPNDGESFPRWSYSYPGADFSSASVTMTLGGSNVPVTLEPVTTGAGDNTIVWIPSSVPNVTPSSDQTYQINISGISGPISSANYSVTLINPNTVNDLPVITGTKSPPAGVATTYQFSSTDQAEGYTLTTFEAASSVWTEGAEASPVPNVVDDTDASYDLLSSAQSATGSQSFHLATPDFNEDRFSIDRLVVPDSSSSITFKYRRLFMHPDTKLRVELSVDEGSSFTTVETIDGGSSSVSSVDWDPGFINASIDVPADFENKTITLRFSIDPTGATFLGSDNNIGVYIDDVSISNTTELSNPSTQTLAAAATSFDFTPGSVGQSYRLVLQPELGGNLFEFGPGLDIQAVSAPPAPSISSSSTAQGVQGEIFSYMITASENPTSFNATGLPAGASINTSTGEITGTIAVGVHSGITISATNGGGTDDALLTITVLSGYDNAVQNLYPGLGAPSADDDGDGDTNLEEIAILGRNPLVSDANGTSQISASITAPNFFFTIMKSGIAGIDYQAVGKSSLTDPTWTTNGIIIQTDNASELTVSYSTTGQNSHFLRFEITQNNTTTAE